MCVYCVCSLGCDLKKQVLNISYYNLREAIREIKVHIVITPTPTISFQFSMILEFLSALSNNSSCISGCLQSPWVLQMCFPFSNGMLLFSCELRKEMIGNIKIVYKLGVNKPQKVKWKIFTEILAYVRILYSPSFKQIIGLVLFVSGRACGYYGRNRD